MMKIFVCILITLSAVCLVASQGNAECIGRCGDTNNDGTVNVSDAVWLINFVFTGGFAPSPTYACGDANSDQYVDVSDAVYIINYVFTGGNAPGDCSPGAKNWAGQDCCPFSSCRYFPLEVGNYWIYSSFGEEGQWTVTQKEGDIVHLEIGPGPTTMILRDRGVEIDIELSEGEWGLYYRFVEGSTWLHRDIWECDDNMVLEVLVEPDPVVTAAGVFTDCLRMEWIMGAPCMDAGTMRQWWARDVGLVKWEAITIAGPITEELLEYSVGTR